MIKFLFFDNREIETLEGFSREHARPVKEASNPVFRADAPWEHGNMQLYGSVIRVPDGKFQLWYSCSVPHVGSQLHYAESHDGIEWHRPELDLFPIDGARTNMVFERPHGAAVILDPDDPREDRRYKLLTGAPPSGAICAFVSADGIQWESAVRTPWSPAPHPVIGMNPDCPIGFLRKADGRYVAYHRWAHYHRRVCRAESWDYFTWTPDPRMVFEPGPGDPPQTQFYGIGVTEYGSYEIGTVWIYHTEPEDLTWAKMLGVQEAELAYSRSGYAWHRAAQGRPFIPHGEPGTWEQGNLQCASQPVFLDDEIRYYYAGSQRYHAPGWELTSESAGLGVARLRPDGFVALVAGDQEADLLTFVVDLPSADVRVNARTEPDGWVRVELLEGDGSAVEGYGLDDCRPASGDSLDHRVEWRGEGQAAPPVGKQARFRLRARNARIYSLFVTDPGETPVYHRFRAARP